jgi:hypothetical protein
VELATDPETGAPLARPGTDRVLAEGSAFSRPIFSPDGRSVYALINPLSPRAHMERFPVPGASPAAGPAAAPAVATRGLGRQPDA